MAVLAEIDLVERYSGSNDGPCPNALNASQDPVDIGQFVAVMLVVRARHFGPCCIGGPDVDQLARCIDPPGFGLHPRRLTCGLGPDDDDDPRLGEGIAHLNLVVARAFQSVVPADGPWTVLGLERRRQEANLIAVTR